MFVWEVAAEVGDVSGAPSSELEGSSSPREWFLRRMERAAADFDRLWVLESHRRGQLFCLPRCKVGPAQRRLLRRCRTRRRYAATGDGVSVRERATGPSDARRLMQSWGGRRVKHTYHQRPTFWRAVLAAAARNGEAKLRRTTAAAAQQQWAGRRWVPHSPRKIV